MSFEFILLISTLLFIALSLLMEKWNEKKIKFASFTRSAESKNNGFYSFSTRHIVPEVFMFVSYVNEIWRKVMYRSF